MVQPTALPLPPSFFSLRDKDEARIKGPCGPTPFPPMVFFFFFATPLRKHQGRLSASGKLPFLLRWRLLEQLPQFFFFPMRLAASFGNLQATFSLLFFDRLARWRQSFRRSFSFSFLSFPFFFLLRIGDVRLAVTLFFLMRRGLTLLFYRSFSFSFSRRVFFLFCAPYEMDVVSS